MGFRGFRRSRVRFNSNTIKILQIRIFWFVFTKKWNYGFLWIKLFDGYFVKKKHSIHFYVPVELLRGKFFYIILSEFQFPPFFSQHQLTIFAVCWAHSRGRGKKCLNKILIIIILFKLFSAVDVVGVLEERGANIVGRTIANAFSDKAVFEHFGPKNSGVYGWRWVFFFKFFDKKSDFQFFFVVRQPVWLRAGVQCKSVGVGGRGARDTDRWVKILYTSNLLKIESWN